jgi:regulator of sigma D
MEEKGKSEQLIDKLIKKRKQENDAFMKLLIAIETKGNENHEAAKNKRKSKP